MGSKLSKREYGIGLAKPKKKMRKQKSNSSYDGSTQPLNIDHSEVSAPHTNLYFSPDSPQPLSWHQSLEDLKGQAPPSIPTRTKMPSVPIPREMPSLTDLKEDKENYNLSEDEESDGYLMVEKEIADLWKKNYSPESKEEENDDLHEENEAKINDSTESEKAENAFGLTQSNSKPKVNADGDYLSAHGVDTSFRKAVIPQLITDGEIKGWYFVRNVETGEENYVHKDWVTMTTSDDVESQACFFNEFDRQIAEVKLLERGIENGTYLLRPSTEDGYALSLKCANGSRLPKIRHYKIRVNDYDLFYINTDSNSKTFSNIMELIRYYSEKPGLHCKLKKPLPRDILLNDLACQVSDFTLGKILGSGNFGSVYSGTLHNNKEVAVKLLKDGGSMTVNEFRQEAKTMHQLRHPNLVSLLAICEDSGKIFIITERMSKGALLTLLREDTGKMIKFKDLMDMAIQVAEGMCYLEEMTFVHRDLRAANVLVGDGNITKVADFGLARLLDRFYDHEIFYRGNRETPLPYKWTAPEGLRQQKFTVKSDVWSFGILLYEMVTYGDDPYPAMSNHDSLDWVEKGNRMKRPTKHHCPLALYNIMKQCWLMNPNERPNFEYIKETLIEIQAKF